MCVGMLDTYLQHSCASVCICPLSWVFVFTSASSSAMCVVAGLLCVAPGCNHAAALQALQPVPLKYPSCVAVCCVILTAVGSPRRLLLTVPMSAVCVCRVPQVDTMTLPCKHFNLCQTCANDLKAKGSNCPTCRQPVNVWLKVHKN
jgi:hypothetical protein